MGKAVDYTGRKFGKLTAIRCVGKDKSGKIQWFCKCKCGNEVTITTSTLSSRISCGCVVFPGSTTHGKSNDPEYHSWKSMIVRCRNPNCEEFKNYGGRGIRVCRRWRDSFQKFFDDMGLRPEGTSIDRIDTNGNYEPENCRWATPEEQNRNRRDNRTITAGGETLLIVDWVRRLGGSSGCVHGRLRLGWTEEDAVLTPMGSSRGSR